VTTVGTEDPGIAGLLRAYLAEDDYPRAGALVRAHPELLGDTASAALGRMAKQGPRVVRALAGQHLRFLDRCRTDPDAAFPEGHPVIDPQCYAAVADRHWAAERAETDFDEASSPADRATAAERWSAGWAAVLDEVSLGAAHPALRAALLNDAARAYLLCHYAVGGSGVLLRAAAWASEAVALTPLASPRMATRQSNLGLILLELSESPDTLDRTRDRGTAMKLLRHAARAAAVGTAAWEDCHTRLALGRLHAFWGDGRTAHLDVAVRELTAVWEVGTPQADIAHTLGAVLRQRYEARGRATDLDEAVALLSAAAEATPATSPHRVRRMLDLGVALLDLHQRNPADAALVAAGSALREALEAAPLTSPDRVSALGHYSGYWYRVFETGGELAALQVALGLAREAAEASVARAGEHAAWLVNLAVITEEIARQSVDLGLLDTALDTFTAALRADPPSLVRRAALAGIGGARRDRFALSQDPEDLRQAVLQLERAAPDGPPRSPEDVRIALLLALSRFERYVFTDTPSRAAPGGPSPAADLHAGLLAALTSVRSLARRRTVPLDRHRVRATLLIVTLAAAEAGLVEASLPALRRTVRRIRADAPQTDPETLLWIGTIWGRWASGEGRPRDAALGYRIAVETLNELARRQADRHFGTWWLRSGGRLTGEAAHAAVAAGDPREAARLMETGRCVLLSEALLLRAMQTGPAPVGLPHVLVHRLTAAARRLRNLEGPAPRPADAP
jgi:tetratricopeptide (TPR) repeat protein